MMELDDLDLRELAVFFAKRMDVELQPRSGRATSDGIDAWVRKLAEAQEGGELLRLVGRVARTDRGDELLQEACDLFHDRRAHTESFVLGGVIFAVAAVMMVFTAVSATAVAVATAVDGPNAVVEIE